MVFLRVLGVTALAGLVAGCGSQSSPASSGSDDGGGGADGSIDAGECGGMDGASEGASPDGGTPSLGPVTLATGYPNLDLPTVGATSFRVLTPTLLELGLVTTKAADPAPITQWNFVDANGQASALPPASNFVVHAGSATVPVTVE